MKKKPLSNKSKVANKNTWIDSAKNKWKAHSRPFRFLVSFMLLMIVFYLFFVSPFFQNNILQPITIAYATVSSFLLNIFGMHTSANGDVISNTDFSISIKAGCDAIQPIALFVFAIIALPASISHKLRGIIVGSVFLLCINIIRIISLFIIGIYIPSIFKLMHFEVWQAIFILLSIASLIYWVHWVNKQKTKQENVH